MSDTLLGGGSGGYDVLPEHHGGVVVAEVLPNNGVETLREALGGRGERVERPEELHPALERALASGQPTVIDVLTDPDRPNEILRNMGTSIFSS